MKDIGERNNMEEWKEYKLGDVSSVSSSKRIFADEYQSEGIPFYRSKEIIEKQKGISIANELYIKESRYNEIKNKFGVPQKGDILLTSVGTLGIPYLVKDEIFYFKDGNITWFYNFKGINNRYLYYWFLSPIAKHYFDIKAIGSTQKALTIETLKKFDIVLPSKSIQQKVADVLKSFDDKIELNNRINANLEEQAQALFRRWFVENKNKKWTYVDLGSVVKTTSGGTPSRSNLSYYENGTVKWLKSKELKGTYITQTEEKITQYAVENSSAKLLPQNSVLIAMYGATVGEYAIIAEKMTCNQAICALLPNENYPCFYLFMLAKNKKEELVNLAVGSAQQNISQVSIKQVQVPTCKELIRKYDKLVAPYFEKILNNIKQNQSLCQLRDILLPKLMNGEI